MDAASPLAITSAQVLRNSSSGNSSSEGREREKLAEEEGSRTEDCVPTRHEASPPHVPGDQALGFEQLVGGGNGGPIQSKLASQFPSGW